MKRRTTTTCEFRGSADAPNACRSSINITWCTRFDKISWSLLYILTYRTIFAKYILKYLAQKEDQKAISSMKTGWTIYLPDSRAIWSFLRSSNVAFFWFSFINTKTKNFKYSIFFSRWKTVCKSCKWVGRFSIVRWPVEIKPVCFLVLPSLFLAFS